MILAVRCCLSSVRMIVTRSLLLSLVCVVDLVVTSRLPPTFKRCKRQDQVCLKEAIQDAIPKFAKGFKSLGVPGLDPLSIPLMEIPGGTGVVKINQKISDGKLYGLSTAILEEFHFDIDNGRVEWSFRCPNITLKANYEMTGQILVLPVKGKGNMEVNIENVQAHEKIGLDLFEKNNEKYTRVNETSLNMEARHVHFNLENVFDGNKELSDQINKVMNDNWSVVFDEIKNGYNDAIKTFCDHIVNMFFSRIPLNEIFLDY